MEQEKWKPTQEQLDSLKIAIDAFRKDRYLIMAYHLEDIYIHIKEL